jgi:hypothetical protein
MAKKNALMEIVTKVVDLLDPLEPEERSRAIQLSLTYFGKSLKDLKPETEEEDREEEQPEQSSPVHATAKLWMKQNKISADELQQVFHDADGTISVISEIRGKNNREKTLNAYVLEGVRNLLSTGKPTFDDQSARELCKSSGCYDKGNHSNSLSKRGNLFTGTKEKGWILTAPGLKRGATLVKELNQKSE